MPNLRLSFACGPYDRMQALYDGRVGIDGVDLVPMPISHPMEVFSRMLDDDAFDISEMSLAHCFALRARNTARFVSIPIFPSRMFRHGFIFVNARSGIQKPADLSGMRIGVQGYQMTAAVWIRGLLRNDFGVKIETVRWFEGGVNEKGVAGGASTSMRPESDLDIRYIGNDVTLSDMLARGEIDALIGALKPDSLKTSPDVVRLFPNFHQTEREYFRSTGIHPIMHALVIRTDLYDEHPWLAKSVFEACESAKRLSLAQTRFTGALRFMLPWLVEDLEEIDDVFGGDPWPYGIDGNTSALDAFNRYLVEDGFYSEPLPLGEVFVPVS
jgi:4,5-dihydroxyphthalate decarboxylase